MFLTKKIDKNIVAVVDTDPVSISIRKSGKEYYGTEDHICRIKDGKVLVNKEIAAKYGLDIVIE